jgi:hypothetical protein
MELVKPKFKIGNKVRYIGKPSEYFKETAIATGTILTIRGIWSTGFFDDKARYWHPRYLVEGTKLVLKEEELKKA